MTVKVADVMSDVRYWLRNDPDSRAFHAGRVFFRIPDDDKVSGWPLIRIYRLGGGDTDNGDVALDEPLISIECWGNNRALYQQVRSMAVAVQSSLRQIPPGTRINPAGRTVCLAAKATTVIDSPDPDAGWPRIIVDSHWVIQPL